MPDFFRWRTPATVREFIADELDAAPQATDPWPHLERAHIASQPWAWPHTRVHVAMLITAIRERDRREVAGQIVRIMVAGPGSIAGRYPSGNTGRSTMALTQTAVVPDDLRTLLERVSQSDSSISPGR